MERRGVIAGWYVGCRSAQLRPRRPLPRTLLGVPLVLFRDTAGRAAALVDRCPHRQAPLSRGFVRDGLLVCPYHGWRFAGDGECRAVPGLLGEPGHASRRADPLTAHEQDGFVWLTPAEPAAPPPRFALVGQPGVTHLVGEAALQGELIDALENFLDPAHTHFVHAGLIRSEGPRRVVTAIVRRRRDGVEVEYPDEGRQTGIISRLFGGGVDQAFGRFRLPSVAELEYRARGRTRLLITLCFTPETPGSLRLFAVVAGRAPRLLALAARPALRLLFRRALLQDRRILELQARNRARFPDTAREASTELDLVRPHLARLLQHGPDADGAAWPERVVHLSL